MLKIIKKNERKQEKEKKEKNTYEMWHLTCDTWHQIFYTWHVTDGGRWTFSQNSRSLALTVWDWGFCEDIFTKHESVSWLIIEKAVCRTAQATPGLLKQYKKKKTTTIIIHLSI